MTPLSIAIPTYRREQVLINTLTLLLAQSPRAAEILVIDQTAEHTPAVTAQLQQWDQSGDIRWIRRAIPSIPAAMNAALRAAQHPLVLFLDDDLIPEPGLISGHLEFQQDESVWAVVGQVLQPGEVPTAVDCVRDHGLRADLRFAFFSVAATDLQNVMAGNLSVKRERAIACGGFDENFVGAAYRFETEFARRLIASGGRIRFQPASAIHHLRAPSGGTRAKGSHLTSADPIHGVGDYYFALCQSQGLTRWAYILQRFFREVRTRFHLWHPWWIPIKWIGEWRAIVWALRLHRAGPKWIR